MGWVGKVIMPELLPKLRMHLHPSRQLGLFEGLFWWYQEAHSRVPIRRLKADSFLLASLWEHRASMKAMPWDAVGWSMCFSFEYVSRHSSK